MPLEVITGPMFSGKTTRLIALAVAAADAGEAVVAVQPEIDTRSGRGHLRAHTGAEFPAIAAAGPVELQALGREVDVLVADEIQFLEPGFGMVLQWLARTKMVVAAGLDRNFRGEPFGLSPSLARVADKLVELTSICSRCGRPATMTQRFTGSLPSSFAEPEVVVGGSERYAPRCRACWMEERGLSVRRRP